jgi:hypothetical protein
MKLCSGKLGRPVFQESAVILLEVVLALALFVAAAAIFTATINSSMASLDRQTLNLHAENLACSLLAEVQIGARPLTEGVIPLDAHYEGWVAEIVSLPVAQDLGETGAPLVQLEVIVRHTNATVVKRLAQALNMPTAASSEISGESLP